MRRLTLAREPISGQLWTGGTLVKKYIRDMIDDLKGRNSKPPVPQTVPEDLNNQILSDDPLQRERQLDFQAQQSEERQKLQ
jgi:hypothetical protein